MVLTEFFVLICSQGLEWMLRREQKGEAVVGRSRLSLHPGWLQLVTRQGFVFYMHRINPFYITTTFYPAPVGGTCGGFLCDEMVSGGWNSQGGGGGGAEEGRGEGRGHT